jgi:hypothetical protein
MCAAPLSLVDSRIVDSKSTFLDTVRPVLNPLFPAGDLLPTEGVDVYCADNSIL